MIKTMLAFLLVALAGCAGSANTAAEANRNRLATVVATYGSVQAAAEVYLNRPSCNAHPTIALCSSPTTVRAIQAADRTAFTAIDRTNQAVKANPSDPSLPQLITGAGEAVAAFGKVTPTYKEP